MTSFLQDTVEELKKNYSLDLRALALMRIGIALLLLTDLIIRATDLEAHYTDQGVLPLAAFYQHGLDHWRICIHTLSGNLWFQILLFFIAGIFHLTLLTGYRTTLSAFCSWLLLLSLQNRNPLILQSGDDLLLMVLFWGIFLPWGNYYSFDGRAESKNKITYLGTAGFAYMLLIFSLYAFSVTLKNSPEWKEEGTAVYYALSLDQMVQPLGKRIYPYPELLKALTYCVYYTELLVPFFFFIPIYNSFFRTAGVLILALFHLGIGLTLFVGLFFLIGIITLIGLLPERAMDKIDPILSGFFSKPLHLHPPADLKIPDSFPLKEVFLSFTLFIPI